MTATQGSLTQDQKREELRANPRGFATAGSGHPYAEQQQKFAQMKEEAKERRDEKKDKSVPGAGPQVCGA
jgi:hypothetical protein